MSNLDFLEGWAGVDGTPQPQTEAQQNAANQERQEAYELASAVLATFGTPTGKRVLAEMRAASIEKPVLTVNRSLVDRMLEMQITPEQWLWLRAGQNSVIHWVDEQIVRALEGPPVDEQPVADEGTEE